MDIYKINTADELIRGTSYVGRGIIVGKTPNGEKAGVVEANKKISVSAEYVDSNGKKWGKVSGGWVNVKLCVF